jgi:hypothetical protein
VSPDPVTNYAFTKSLGKVLHRPAVLPLPAFMVRLMFGEMGETLLLSGSRVVPTRLEAHGYRFMDNELTATLFKLLNK